jgi:rhodanese-related sulfurtransferase
MFNFLRPSAPATPLSEVIAAAKAGTTTLIDVRDISEVKASGRAAGALHIPLMRLSTMCDPRHPDFAADLRLDKPVALYCASGARSGMAAGMLRKLGFTDVTNIGGLGDWVQAGGAVQR